MPSTTTISSPIFSAHLVRSVALMPQGLPLLSIELHALVSSVGALSGSISDR